MMMCTDGRFEIIAKAKKDILETTNINTSPDEMKVLDNFLFRCWQMDWLERYEQPKVGEWIPCSERLPEEDGWYLTTVVYGNVKASGMCKFVNGVWEHFDAGFNDIAWMELPPAYKGE